MKILPKLFILLLAIQLFVSCNDDDNVNIQPDPTITDLAIDTDDLSILVEALVQVGLENVLDDNTGEYTVFAPTNDAFEDFFTEIGVSEVSEIPNAVLEKVLLNHVLGEIKLSGDLMTGYETVLAQEATTQNNINLYVNTEGGVMLNGESMVETADIVASNGVVHIVDDVIALPTVVTFAVADPTFDILQAALTRDSFNNAYINVLSGTENSPFTVFAPTNDAFVDLLEELDVDELDDIDDATLGAALEYHVVTNANVLSSDLTDNQTVTTFEGSDFMIDLDNGPQIIDANNRVADIIVTDVQANNGVLHVLNKVLLP